MRTGARLGRARRGCSSACPPRPSAAPLGVFLLGVTVYAGLRGTEAPDRNFAITFVFVTVWLGLPVLSVLFGNVFKPFNPWRAIGRAVGGGFTAIAGQRPAHLAYPRGSRSLARRDRPARLRLAGGRLQRQRWRRGRRLSPHDRRRRPRLQRLHAGDDGPLRGREVVRAGEVFSVYFGMFSRLGPFGVRDGRLGVRRPLSAATIGRPSPARPRWSSPRSRRPASTGRRRVPSRARWKLSSIGWSMPASASPRRYESPTRSSLRSASSESRSSTWSGCGGWRRCAAPRRCANCARASPTR